MLVRFKSDVGGFTMFGDVAVRLLRMTGHSGSVPGAIPAEDVAVALASLEGALATAQAPPPDEGRDKESDREPPVTLAQRAWPLLEMLRNAQREECGVMWDRA